MSTSKANQQRSAQASASSTKSNEHILVKDAEPLAVVDLSEFIDPSPWSDDFAVFNLIVYGEPGCGKTPFVCTVVDVEEMMPALLIDGDSGTLSVRKIEGLKTIHLPKFSRQLVEKYKRDFSPWKALEQIYGFLRFREHDFKTVILDGGTDIQRFCELDCITVGIERTEGNREHDPELAEIGDYRRIYERMKRMYMRFRDLLTVDGRRVNLLATAHERVYKEELTGQVAIVPSYLGQGALMNMSVFDIVCRMVNLNQGGGNSKTVKSLVPCLEGKARGRDRSTSLGDRLTEPTVRKVFDAIHGGINGTNS